MQAAALAFSGEDDIEQIEDSLITGSIIRLSQKNIFLFLSRKIKNND